MPINNTFYGTDSLQNNTGDNNTAIGAYSLTNNLDPSCNTAVGSNTLYFNISGAHNTALGAGAMCNNVVGGINTAVGSSALEGVTSETTTGEQNVAVGAQSLYINNGDQNTSVGTYSLFNNTDGSNNVALGFFAGGNNVNGSNNTFLGSRSGQQTGDANIYEYATAIGAGSIIDASNQIIMGRPLGQDSVEVPGTLSAKKMFLTDIFPPYPSEPNAVMPKAYIDQVASGLNPIGASKCLANNTASPVNLLAAPPAQIDGYTLQDGDKVLINDQANLVDNGIWIANTIAGNWSRPPLGQNMSIGYNADGALSFVTNGNTYQKTAWVQVETPAIVGTDNLLFDIFFQFTYQIGQGLEVITVGPNEVLQVKDTLTFLQNITVGQTITANNIVQTGTITQSGTGTNTMKAMTMITNTNLTQSGTGIISQSGSGTNALKDTTLTGTLNVINTLNIGTSAAPNAGVGFVNGGLRWVDVGGSGKFTNSFKTGDVMTFTGNNPSSSFEIYNRTASNVDQRTFRASVSNADISSNAINLVGPTTTDVITQRANSNLIQSGTGIISQLGTGTNALKQTAITTSFAAGGVNSSFDVTNSTNTNAIYFVLNPGAGSYNSLTQAGDIVFLASGAAQNAKNLTITTWTSAGAGIRLTSSTLRLAGAASMDAITQTANASLTQSGTGIISQTGTGTNALKATDISGNLTVTGTATATSFTTTSDYRIKEDVKPLTLDKYNVDNIKPVVYKNKLSKEEDIGVIAHELQEEYPFLVVGEKDAEDSYQSVKYSSMIGILIKEIQELKARVKELEGNVQK